MPGEGVRVCYLIKDFSKHISLAKLKVYSTECNDIEAPKALDT